MLLASSLERLEWCDKIKMKLPRFEGGGIPPKLRVNRSEGGKPQVSMKKKLAILAAAIGVFLLGYFVSRPKLASLTILEPPAPSPVSLVNAEPTDAPANTLLSKAGYEIIFSVPTYEFNEEYARPSFGVDVEVLNVSFTPFMSPSGNCDIAQNGKVIQHGAGVMLSEIHDIYPGESAAWRITLLLDPDDRVVRCSYSPTGSYDPNISVHVAFESL